MTSKFEYKGYWYLPNKQENAIAGILTYIPNETLKLELIGAIDKSIPDIFNLTRKDTISVIWGETSEAKKVTLLNCIPSGTKQNFDCSFPILCFSIQYCLIGYHHLEEFEEKVFDWSSVEIPALTMWCFPGALKYLLTFSPDNKSINQMSVSFCPEELKDPIVSVPINETTLLNLLRGVQFDESDFNLNPTFKQNTYLEIRKNQKITISEFLADIRQFESFMSLASLSKLNASKILLYDDTVYQETTDNKRSYHPTELVYVQNNSESEPKNM